MFQNISIIAGVKSMAFLTIVDRMNRTGQKNRSIDLTKLEIGGRFAGAGRLGRGVGKIRAGVDQAKFVELSCAIRGRGRAAAIG